MAAHIEIHTADSEGDVQYSCNQCSFVAKFRENVYEHIRALHEIEKDFEDNLENECFSCDKCDYETIFQDNLLVHECDDTVARYRPLKSYTCNQCDYETLFQENMEGHRCEEWRRDESVLGAHQFIKPSTNSSEIFRTPYYP